MTGNGADDLPGTFPAPSEAQPQSTGSMWGEMFGLGGLFKLLNDPGLQTHAQGMMGAIIEGARISRRIEAKLDLILGAQGHDVQSINARFAPPAAPPAVLVGHSANGNRGLAPPGGASDDGSGGAAPDARGDRGGGGPAGTPGAWISGDDV